ncbi:MAG: hypothetical protein CMJ34_08910 [Phycisphaerae bacterium]|nr:hypothetical protein [Phycisphaerae bacterium]
MTDQKRSLAALFTACSQDDALKARFMNDPRAVLTEHGIDVPDDREIRVVENTPDCHHLTLPRLPSAMLMMFEVQTMTPEDEGKKALAALFAKCCKDEALKKRFIGEPEAVMKEHGIDVPEALDIKVIENTEDHVHITLPNAPSDELSDDDLRRAVGGYYETIAKTGARSL